MIALTGLVACGDSADEAVDRARSQANDALDQAGLSDDLDRAQARVDDLVADAEDRTGAELAAARRRAQKAVRDARARVEREIDEAKASGESPQEIRDLRRQATGAAGRPARAHRRGLPPVSKVREAIDGRLEAFLMEQPVFFVGTAPAGGEGHVNVSPKGLAGSFTVLGPHTVAYLDLTGSGAETIAHLRDDGRICLMFCAFTGPPKIVRLHGRAPWCCRGRRASRRSPRRFAERPGVRSVIRVDVDRVSDSCGFGVPLMSLEGDRASS